MQSISWLDSIVTELYASDGCGPLYWTLTNQDGTLIDNTVLNVDDPANPHELTAQTDDPSKAAIYPLKVSVFYTNFPDNIGGFIDFEIHVTNKCETAYTMTPSSHPAINYLVARPVASKIFDAFTVVPSYCSSRVSYEFTISPALVSPDDTAVQMDSATRTLTTQTDNIGIAGVYTITVSALTPGGVNSGVSFDMSLNI